MNLVRERERNCARIMRFDAFADRQLLVGGHVRQPPLDITSSRVSLPPRSARRHITNSMPPLSKKSMDIVPAPCKEPDPSCYLYLHVRR